MGGRQSTGTTDPIRTRWSPNGPKTGPPGELFTRSPLDPPRTPMKSAVDFEVYSDPLRVRISPWRSAGQVFRNIKLNSSPEVYHG